jgi:hypothetical protein
VVSNHQHATGREILIDLLQPIKEFHLPGPGIFGGVTQHCFAILSAMYSGAANDSKDDLSHMAYAYFEMAKNKFSGKLGHRDIAELKSGKDDKLW